METIGIPSLLQEADLILIDEIGKMELLSSAFKETLEILFKGKGFILGTISFYDSPDTIKLKQMSHTKVIEITLRNRDNLHDTIMQHILTTNYGS